MTREDVTEKLLNISNNNILVELPTGFGKSKYGLDIMDKRKPEKNILIVIPRLVLIENWKDEIHKWGYDKYISMVEFSTYKSFPKKAGKYDLVIFDEVQHLSERCQEALDNFEIKNSVLLSATVKKSLKQDLQLIFKDLYCYKVSMKEAIEEDILPDPKVYLIPLTLDNQKKDYVIVKNPKGIKPTIKVDYFDRWNVIKSKKKNRIEISCTQAQYITDLDNMISFWKRRFIASNNEAIKNKWLHTCGERLKWFAEQKNDIVLQILSKLKNERTLTFCNNIDQTEILGKYAINSKSADSGKNLELFNSKRINHITACNMLNEGMNLVECRVGIYANLNSSEIIIKQRLGRILRHKDPILIIPYYKGTREEELVDKMLEDYNPALIQKVTLKDLNI